VGEVGVVRAFLAKRLLTQPSPPKEERALKLLLPFARVRGEGLGEVGGSVTNAPPHPTLSSKGGEGFCCVSNLLLQRRRGL